MSFHHLDQFAHVDSAITRRSPTVRLLVTVIIAFGAALLPIGAWPQIAALALLVAGLAALARVHPRTFLARVGVPLTFVALVSAGLLVLAPGTPLARMGPITVTDEGVRRFASALGRAAVALAAAVLLVSTTRFTELLAAFRALRLPTAVTTSLGLAYRFLYLLNDEVDRLRRAARSRNAAAGAAPRRRLMTGIAATALRRSFDRSERVYHAMLGRGFTGSMPSLHPRPAAGRPVLEVGAAVALVALLVVSARL